MYGISLSKILQEARTHTDLGRVRYFSGGIESIERLLEPKNLTNLQRVHNGLYCFLAFHPTADFYISEYIQKGSLPSDSGKQIMVLFISSREMRVAQPVQIEDLKIELDQEIHPAYEAVNTLFPTRQVSLPGIIFFEDFITSKDSIYVQIEKIDSFESATTLLRNIFKIARISNENSKKKNSKFLDQLAIQLGTNYFNYQRSGNLTHREWLIKVYNIVKKTKSDIIAAVGLAGLLK